MSMQIEEVTAQRGGETSTNSCAVKKPGRSADHPDHTFNRKVFRDLMALVAAPLRRLSLTIHAIKAFFLCFIAA